MTDCLIGPITGGFAAKYTTWRWIFWAVSIADAAIQVFGLVFLRETWAPKVLEERAKKLRQETGNRNLYVDESVNCDLISQKLKLALIRPIQLLCTQPIIIALALYMGYMYGLVSTT